MDLLGVGVQVDAGGGGGAVGADPGLHRDERVVVAQDLVQRSLELAGDERVADVLHLAVVLVQLLARVQADAPADRGVHAGGRAVADADVDRAIRAGEVVGLDRAVELVDLLPRRLDVQAVGPHVDRTAEGGDDADLTGRARSRHRDERHDGRQRSEAASGRRGRRPGPARHRLRRGRPDQHDDDDTRTKATNRNSTSTRETVRVGLWSARPPPAVDHEAGRERPGERIGSDCEARRGRMEAPWPRHSVPDATSQAARSPRSPTSPTRSTRRAPGSPTTPSVSAASSVSRAPTSVQVDFGDGAMHIPLPCRSMTAL